MKNFGKGGMWQQQTVGFCGDLDHEDVSTGIFESNREIRFSLNFTLGQ